MGSVILVLLCVYRVGGCVFSIYMQVQVLSTMRELWRKIARVPHMGNCSLTSKKTFVYIISNLNLMRKKDKVPFILLSGGNCERQTIKSSSQAFQHV